MVRFRALLLAAAAALAACGDNSAGASTAHLLDTPTGYTLDDRPADLGASDAAALSIADPQRVAADLPRLGFRYAAARVFHRGTAFLVDSAIALDSPPHAAALAAEELSSAAQAVNATAFPSSAAPGATGYVIDSATRVGGSFVFCQGVVFAAGAIVYEIRQCGPAPTDGQGPLAGALAHEQYLRTVNAHP